MTEYYLIYEIATGEFRMKGQGPEGTFAAQQIPAGRAAILVSEESWMSESPPVEEAAQAIIRQIKARRDAVIDGGAPTAIGVIDSDASARANVTGAVVGATIAKAAGAPFSITWTDIGNGFHTLDADGMIALGMAMLAHVNAAHDNARALIVAVSEAATLQEALQIDVEDGWTA